MGRQQETFVGNEAQPEGGVVVHAMPDLVTVPLADGPTLDARTTQVWHRSHAERALAATLDAASLPVVDVPVPRAGEQTLIIRRPVRRKPIDWHTPGGLAAVLAVTLAVSDWSQRHPVRPPANAAAETEGPTGSEAVAAPPGVIVEALAQRAAEGGASHGNGKGASERAGLRAARASGPARNAPGRPVTKTRARWNGRGVAPGARGGRIPPAPVRTDEDEGSSDAGSAMAHSTTRTRASNRSDGLPSSVWVDPFASY